MGKLTRDAALAGRILREGGLIAFPTETVYGVGARHDRPAAVARLRELKGREAAKPFQNLILTAEQGGELGAVFSAAAKALATAFWPGALTLVLPATGGGTVGLRCPASELTRKLIELTGVPLAASSANRGGEAPAADGAAALAALGDKVDLVLLGDETPAGQASSVVQVTENRLRLLREEALRRGELAAALGGLTVEWEN